MSRIKNKSALAGGVIIAASLLSNAGQAAETITLRMANWLPPVSHMTGTLGDWVAEVDKASGGTIKITVLPPGLAKPPGQYDLARNGVTDIAWIVAAYTPGRFPVFRALELPFLSPNAEIGSAALWDWYARSGAAPKEFSDTKLLNVWVHGPGVLHSQKKITRLEDLRGLKIRVGGGGVAMAAKLGAVPVAMSATKANESLQRGTTTATLFPYESLNSFSLTKLVTNTLEIPGGLYTTPFAMVMNTKSWNKLSAEQKAALGKVSYGWGSRFIGKRWDWADEVGKKGALANGNTIRTIDPAELKRWSTKVQFMFDDWIARVDKKGYDGKALLSDLRATMKKYGG